MGSRENVAGKPAPLDGFARRREQSKDRIRSAAWALFSQFGIEKVSIADIAHQAGVSPATIYNNFEGKEALAREFVAAAIEQLVGRAQAALLSDQPYPDKMAALVRSISEIIAHRGPPSVEDAVFASGLGFLDDPEIVEIRDAAKERMADLLLALVQEDRELGQIDLGIGPKALRIYFKAFMDLFADPRLQREYAREPKIVQDLGQLMVYGLGGKVPK